MNRFFIVPLLAFAWSCASIPPSPGRVEAPADPTKVLLAQEIRSASVRNAYEAIQLLRPRFLSFSRGGEAGTLAVYVDDAPVSDISDLRNISAASVREIVLLAGPEATIRYPRARTADAVLVVRTMTRVR